MNDPLSPDEISRRRALVTEECGGIVPYFRIFYILSVEYSARAAVSAFMAFGERGDAPDSQMVAWIHDALGHCAALSRYFWPATKDKMAQARGHALRELFKVTEHSPLKDRNLRNSLEHFDERLDEFMINGAVGHLLPQAMLGSHYLADDPIGHIFKLVDPDADIFVLLNEKFEFGPLSQEASRILLLADELS